MKRAKLPKLSTVRNKCDDLLTPIVKKQSPYCEGCGAPTQVAHHWIEKSRSSYLRFDLRNLIALCHSCHTKIHNRFGSSVMGSYNVADRIVKNRGKKWKQTLEIDSVKYVKVDVHHFLTNYERLIKLL